MGLVGKYVIITLIGGRQLMGKIVDEDAVSIYLKEGPNPAYSHKPPVIIQRARIETINVR
ncbi:MAG: hypothetical protein IBX40_06930 [Methanosarcinales archaeon]|nr:hypothetical protein [Methanosarcinales archaeon]